MAVITSSATNVPLAILLDVTCAFASIRSARGPVHSEILEYLSLHFSSTLAVLPNLIVQSMSTSSSVQHATKKEMDSSPNQV